MKKKGFTLIELIVVIAIIGVLAAILVPAMLGYVKRSKITTANTSAKQLYTAVETALTEIDSADDKNFKIRDLVGKTVSMDGATFANTANGLNSVTSKMAEIATRNFEDVSKISELCIAFGSSAGKIQAIAVYNGAYMGTYPKMMTVEDWDSLDGTLNDLTDGCSYATT